MNIEEFSDYCLSIKGASGSFPFFDKRILVFKVMEKMFAYLNIEPKDGEFRVSMKCEPSRSMELRERYEGITHGQHAGNSFTWNAVNLQSDVPDSVIKELVDISVSEVIKKLPKMKQAEYNSL
ncbi:MmcQ/YjbR family DNA-binding protein [Dysgonomonas sp. ZJ709]|uniref:MmcQ/YjbR family DNA-binding protein n=1 Tax=Dysgonomonas sp. ZJ709 TaxID=2709797 RepID=UPI0013EB6517|nr:MmcQ/YjbR family DNA-binding protein [Dysgonomonas sp. ZJ709]